MRQKDHGARRGVAYDTSKRRSPSGPRGRATGGRRGADCRLVMGKGHGNGRTNDLPSSVDTPVSRATIRGRAPRFAAGARFGTKARFAAAGWLARLRGQAPRVVRAKRLRLLGERAQTAQSPVLGHPDGAGRHAEHLSGLLGGEAHGDP